MTWEWVRVAGVAAPEVTAVEEDVVEEDGMAMEVSRVWRLNVGREMLVAGCSCSCVVVVVWLLLFPLDL